MNRSRSETYRASAEAGSSGWKMVRWLLVAVLAGVLVSSCSKKSQDSEARKEEMVKLLEEAKTKARGEEVKKLSCVSNLKQVYTALNMYASYYKGCFPQNATVANWLIPSKKTWHCPMDGEYKILAYGHRSRLIRDPVGTIIAICPNEHGTGLLNVLFADGHVASVDADVVRRSLENRSGGRLPVLK